ncbi:MAG: ABC transporter permease [Acidobacteriaceae bacterium]|nr:ABC transporter permease [Acidobacteriaceae bacterium]
METLLQDVRYGFRMLRKSPGFAAVAIITLALGIGANTAIFSVVSGVLLNPLPYPQPDELVAIYQRSSHFTEASIPYPNFLDWQRDNRSFAAIAAYRSEDFNLTGLGNPERLKGGMVSASFFPIFGVKPLLGRTFTESEDLLGGAPVALITQELWKQKFGSSPDIVGKSLDLNDTLYTIVGIIPASFHYRNNNFGEDKDVFIPLGQWNDPLFRDRHTGMGMDAVGRLKPGVTVEQARADMNAVAAHLAQIYPDSNKNSGVTLVPLKQNLVGDEHNLFGNVRPFLLVLLAAVGFVLLIACANVANLLLARSTARMREVAVRTALGASPRRIVRQVLTESLLLALIGGALGLLIAAWGTQAAIKVLPDGLPRADEIHLDGPVLMFTLGASILAGILFGSIPAWKIAGTNLQEILKEGGRGSSGRHRTQGVIVAVEMALALVLLAGAGLMIRSIAKLWYINPGFDPRGVMSFELASGKTLGSTPAAIRSAFRQLHGAIAAVPGVQSISLTAGSSVMEGDSEVPLWLEGEPKPFTQSEMKESLFYVTQPDYLQVMRVPLRRGRFLQDSDNETTAPVVVIDEEFARRFFGNRDPIGARVNFSILNLTAEVVGITGHVKQWGLDENEKSPVHAQCYFSLFQTPDGLLSLFAHGMQAVARTEPQIIHDVHPISRAVQSVNGDMVVYRTMTMTDVIAESLATQRFAMMLLGIFAALATVLASVGIYGVISYIASQRTHEIGIRMALGAKQGDVLRMVLSQAGRMAIIGVAIGLVAGFVLMRLMASLLFGVSTHDPITFIAVALLLIIVALAACYIPARRASAIDPMDALRYE